jgi:hypothetical protein
VVVARLRRCGNGGDVTSRLFSFRQTLINRRGTVGDGRDAAVVVSRRKCHDNGGVTDMRWSMVVVFAPLN